MHEISIVNSIVKTLEIEFNEEKLSTLKTIFLRVGILSNIEPKLLHNAFESYQHSDERFKKVAMEIESTEIQIKCEECDYITNVQQYRFKCEKCEKPSKNIIQGEEMLIHKLEFKD